MQRPSKLGSRTVLLGRHLPGGQHHRSIFQSNGHWRKPHRLPCFMLTRSPSHSALAVLFTHMITHHSRAPRVDIHVIDPHSSVQSSGEREGAGPLAIGGECRGGAGPPFAKTANHVFPGCVLSGAIYWAAAPQFIYIELDLVWSPVVLLLSC